MWAKKIELENPDLKQINFIGKFFIHKKGLLIFHKVL